MKNIVNRELSACETLIMKVVWDAKEDISVRDLLMQLKQYGKDYARTTVVTFLGKMVNKGFVSTYRQGRTAFVHAERPEAAYKSKLMVQEIDFWFDGHLDQMLSAVCEKKKVSKEEIQNMRAVLDKLDK